MAPRKCDVSGCKSPATVEARKLWGKGGSLFCCDACKPDPAKRPESLRHLPFAYEIRPIKAEGPA